MVVCGGDLKTSFIYFTLRQYSLAQMKSEFIQKVRILLLCGVNVCLCGVEARAVQLVRYDDEASWHQTRSCF